jgi:RNA polymerase sigma-70 factor (ECF subfamily)
MKDNYLIIEQLKGGSYQAFNRIYEQYFDLLYGFVLGLTHSHEKTREVVQDAFIKVWINHGKINPELSFKAWLFKMAQNIVIDKLKEQFSNPVFEDYLIYLSDEKLAEPFQDDFDFEMFNKVLLDAKKKLSPRQLQVFELCKENEMSSTEVAQKLHVSEQTVYNYLHQALDILRKEIRPFYLLFLLLFL